MPSGSARMRSAIWLTVWLSMGKSGRGRIGHADAREEQAQIVVDLGDRADRRARIARGRFLLDGNGGRKPLDVIDIGLLHQLQELPRIGRKAFHIAALAFGIDRVEGERGFARARKPGNHRQRVARDLDIDILQVVFARAAYGNVFQHALRPVTDSCLMQPAVATARLP